MGHIKTHGKLPPDDDVRIGQTPSSKTTSIATVNNNAILCKQCRLCKHDVAASVYSSKDSPYCPDCEKALGEIIAWWNSTARDWWVKKPNKSEKRQS